MMRRFKLINHLTLPLGLQAAPGGVHRRAVPGDVVEIDDDRCREHDRFLRGRVRAGDLVEIDVASAAEPARSAPMTAAKER